MSGSTIGGVIGGVVGFFVGGPAGAQLGFMAGSMIGGALDPQVLQGPQLGDIPIQTSQEGAPRPIVYGTPQPFPGNIIQAGPKLISTKETEQGKGGPVIESEEVHQTYAIRICEGPAICIKAWRDGKLVFDRSGTAFFDADSSVFSSKVVMYTGDETQMPSPALEALPAAYGGGAGNVPAYRGTAYMVIENDNLTGTGGRIPNFEFIMSSDATVVEDCAEEGLLAWWPLSDASSEGSAVELIGGLNGEYSTDVGSGPALHYGSSGSAYFSASTERMKAEGTSALTVGDLDAWTCSAWCKPTEITTDSNVIAIAYANDLDGRYSWGIHLGSASHMQPRGGFTHSVGNETTAESPNDASINGIYFIVCTYDSGTLRLYVNGTLVATEAGIGTSTAPADFVQVGGNALGSGDFIGYISDVKLYNYALSQSEINERYVSVADPFYELPDAQGSYVDPNGVVHTFCAGRATTNSVFLSDIEQDIASRCGLASSQFDVSELVAVEVEGFLIGKQMTGAAALQPLATAYFHDLPEYDLQIHARRRGDASVVSLTDDDFVDSGEDEEIRAQAIELPRKLNVYFSDPGANHAVVPVPAERTSSNVQGTGVVGVQLPLVLDRDVAKQKAEIMLKCLYEESQGTLKRELPAFKYAELVASDPITYDQKRWRIDTLEQLEGTIKIEAKRDRIVNYTSSATANDVLDPHDPVSNLKGPSLLKAMNLPRLKTQDDKPGVYLAVTGLLPGWPGAAIYLSVDDGATEQLVTTINARATIGELRTAVDADDEPVTIWVYDNRELLTITEADIALRRNAFALVSSDVAEVSQFITATQNGDDDWELTDVYRGRLGTTAASHAVEDDFVLLDGAVQFLPISSAHIGRTLIFRAVTLGTAPANNPTVSLVFAPLFTEAEAIDYYTTEAGEIYQADDGSYYRAE